MADEQQMRQQHMRPEQMRLVYRVPDPREIFVDGVQGDWQAVRVAGRIKYICYLAQCGAYNGQSFGDRQRLNAHRSQIHKSVPPVVELRRGRKPTDGIPKPSSYSRERYLAEKKDISKVLIKQSKSQYYRMVQKRIFDENVVSAAGLSEEGKKAINEKIQKYDVDENKEIRRLKHIKREDIRAHGCLGLGETNDTGVEENIVQPGDTSRDLETDPDVVEIEHHVDARGDALRDLQTRAGSPHPDVVEVEHHVDARGNASRDCDTQMVIEHHVDGAADGTNEFQTDSSVGSCWSSN